VEIPEQHPNGKEHPDNVAQPLPDHVPEHVARG